MTCKRIYLFLLFALSGMALFAQKATESDRAFFQRLETEYAHQHYSTVFTSADSLYRSLIGGVSSPDSVSSRRLLVSVWYMNAASAEYQEDAVDSAMARYERILPRLMPVDATLCHLLMYDYSEALKDTTQLKEIKVDSTIPFMKRPKNVWFDLTPTMYDLVMQYVIEDNNCVSYYLKVGEVCLHLQRALVAHYQSQAPSVERNLLLIYHERQLGIMQRKNRNQYRRQLLDRYRHMDCDMVAALYHDVAMISAPDTALLLLDTAQSRFPNSPFSINECCALRNKICQKNIFVSLANNPVPNSDFLLKVSSTNIDTAYFRILPFQSNISKKSVSELSAVNPIASWSQVPYDAADYRDSADKFKHSEVMFYAYCPGLPAGSYTLLVSPSANLAEGGFYAEDIRVEQVMFLQVKNGQYGVVSGYLIDKKTGRPVKNHRVTLYRKNLTCVDSKIISVKTDAEGFVVFRDLVYDYGRTEYYIATKYQGSISRIEVSPSGTNKTEKERRTSVLLTDRPVYKPGDTIHFSCVLGRIYNNSVGYLRTGESITLNVSSPNGKKIETQKHNADSLGTVSGTVVLPNNALPGKYYFELCRDYDGVSVYDKYVRVESYKQPKFLVTLSDAHRRDSLGRIITPAMGDSLLVEGMAVSYSQVPLSGAKVKYTVERIVLRPWWRMWEEGNNYYHYGSTKLVADTVAADPEGRFRIAFVAEPGDASDSIFKYVVRVSVTDINGETHSASHELKMGYDNRYIDLHVPSVTSTLKKITFRYCDLNDNPLDGVLDLKVERLSEPAKPYLFYTQPGCHSLSESEFARRYPSYSYRGQGTRLEWPVEKLVYADTIVAQGQPNYAVDLPALEAGMYRVSLRCGTAFSQAVVLYVPQGASQVSYNDGLLWCAIDTSQAYVGDTVNLRLGTRHRHLFVALGISSATSLLESKVIEVDSQVVSIPIVITNDMLGSTLLHLLCVKEGAQYERYCQVRVPFLHKQLDCVFESFRDKLVPGDSETWKIRISPRLPSIKGQLPAYMALTMYDAALDEYGTLRYLWSPWNSNSNYFHRSFPENYYFDEGYRLNLIDKLSCGYDEREPQRWGMNSPIDKWNLRAWRIRKNRNSNRLVEEEEYSVFSSEKVMEPPIIEVGDAASGQRMTADDLARMPVSSVDAIVAAVAGVGFSDNASGEYSEFIEDGVDSSPKMSSEAAVPAHSRDMRTNLSTLSFFEPAITSDSNGVIEYTFTAPDLLTQWSIRGLAWNRQLAVGSLTNSLITQKQMMIEPQLPRFLRQGDSAVLLAKVSNLTDSVMHVEVSFSFEVGMHQQEGKKQLDIPPHTSQPVSFDVVVPVGGTVATYTFKADGGAFRDGERGPLPLLTNRQAVTQSISIFTNGAQSKTYGISLPKSSTAQPVSLTVEYAANPVWLALQTIPYMSEQSDPSNIYLFNSYYVNTLGLQLAQRYPHLQHLADSASEEDGSLFRNDDVRQTLLEETPWLSEGISEVERLKNIANYYHSDDIKRQLDDTYKLLDKNQNSDGGWAWISGGQSSSYVTQYVVKGFGRLRKEAGAQLPSFLKDALKHVDDRASESYQKIIKESSKGNSRIALEPINLDYLYTRSYFRDLPVVKSCQSAYDFYYKNAKKRYADYSRLCDQALLSLVFYRNGDTLLASEMVRRIKEKALYSDEMGMYWRDNRSGWFYYERPIETQALLIETFREVTPADTLSVSRMQQWLLKQKQTTTWDNSIATLHAIRALMGPGSTCNQAAMSASTTHLVVGGDTLQAPDEEGDYLRRTYRDTALQQLFRQQQPLRLQVQSDRTSWGAAYLQYTEQMDKVKSSHNGITLRRTMYKTRPDGSRINNDDPLHVGDRVRITIEIKCDRNLEYVEMKHLRASCLEPISTRSGWSWSDGLRYYGAVNNTHDAMYVSRMDKGRYRITWDYYVTHAGTFTLAPAVLQCLYAPEFRATSSGTTITVLP